MTADRNGEGSAAAGDAIGMLCATTAATTAAGCVYPGAADGRGLRGIGGMLAREIWFSNRGAAETA